MRETIYSAWVPGPPATMGSKRLVRNAATGEAVIRDDNRPKLRSWQSDLRLECLKCAPAEPLNEPVRADVLVLLARPASHFGTGRNAGTLKESAPFWAGTKPDGDKVLRAAMDCLTGIWVIDDARVAVQHIEKRYVDSGETPGTRVVMVPLLAEAGCPEPAGTGGRR